MQCNKSLHATEYVHPLAIGLQLVHEEIYQDPRHPWTDPSKQSWDIPGHLTPRYFGDSSHLALEITPTALLWSKWNYLQMRYKFCMSKHSNLWLSSKRSWAPTAYIGCLWSSESSKAEPAYPQGLIFPQPQRHWELKYKSYQKSVWKCTRLCTVY